MNKGKKKNIFRQSLPQAPYGKNKRNNAVPGHMQ